MAEKFTKAYASNMSSPKGLKTTCEADEGNLLAKLISLELATTDGTKATAGIYEEEHGMKLGHLAFEEYKTDVDETSLKAIHQTKGDTFLFKGQAYIQDKPVKLLVFREKA